MAFAEAQTSMCMALQVSVQMGKLHMIFDTVADEGYTPGQYGEGLAAAFGQNHGLLRNMPRVTQIQQVKFSIGGGFQFDMNMLQSDTPVLCDYLQMAAAIKSHYQLEIFQVFVVQYGWAAQYHCSAAIEASRTVIAALSTLASDSKPCLYLQEANPKRILIATRKESESRRLVDAEKVADHLSSQGWNVSVVTMGDLSFEQQLRMVTDAKALVGVSGSDLVSMLFMPFRAAVVEIFPMVMGVPAYNPELSNQARNCGKVLRPYYSPFNATLFANEPTGEPVDATHTLLRQSKTVKIDVAGLVATIQGAIKASDQTLFSGLTVDIAPGGRGLICSYDRPVPNGILYGCYSRKYKGC